MIEELVPPGVSTAEAFDDERPAPLFPEEEELVARSADLRRREFATVRACARRALGALAVPPGPLLRGEGGAPRWPDGVVGSMTHCKGYRGAVVARAEDVLSIGIDAEPALPLRPGLVDRISGPGEREGLRELGERMPGVCWDRLLFSAKEALYKAAFPLCLRWFGFREAVVELAADGTFAARPLTGLPGAPDRFAGRWMIRGGLLLTSVAVLPGTRRAPPPPR